MTIDHETESRTLTRKEVMEARANDPADKPTGTKTCEECGKPHNRPGNAKTCGEACSNERDKKRQRESTARSRARAKANPKPEPAPEPEPTETEIDDPVVEALVDILATELVAKAEARARQLLGL